MAPRRPFYLNIIADRNGHANATCWGPQFVYSLFDLFFPGGIVYRRKGGNSEPQMWLVGSNSWLVVKIWPMEMSSFLTGGGWTTGILSELSGFRRITIVPAYGASGSYRFWSELRSFVNNSWSDLSIENRFGYTVLMRTKSSEPLDPLKLRTFGSMFEKVFDGLRPHILPRSRSGINDVTL